MESIVIELQRNALDRDVSVADLLRKALVVARKLKIKEFEDWISKELGGYSNNSEIPDYREMDGRLEGLNPYSGWQSIVFPSTESEKMVSKRKSGQRIAEIENLLAGQADMIAQMSLSPEQQQLICQWIGSQIEIRLTISDASLVGVLDTVRNIILNWALKLEEDGMLGEGMTFSDNEKTEAGKHSYNVNNFYGPITNTQIQQGSPKSEQSIRVDGVSMDSVAQFINALREELPNLTIEDDAHRELSSDIATVEVQISSPNPKEDIIRTGLGSIRRILEGASGGIAAQLLMQLQSLI